MCILPVHFDTLLWSCNIWLQPCLRSWSLPTAELEAISADFLNLPNSFPSNTSRNLRNALQATSTISNLGNALAEILSLLSLQHGESQFKITKKKSWPKKHKQYYKFLLSWPHNKWLFSGHTHLLHELCQNQISSSFFQENGTLQGMISMHTEDQSSYLNQGETAAFSLSPCGKISYTVIVSLKKWKLYTQCYWSHLGLLLR